MKKRINKLTLKWKIFAFLLGFCAILLVILWLFQTVLLESFYRGIMVSEIKSNAAVIAKNIDNENLSDLLSSISVNGNVGIGIISADGTELYASDNLMIYTLGKMQPKDRLELAAKAEEDDGEYLQFKSDFHPHEFNDDFIGNVPINKNQEIRSLMYVKVVETASGEKVTILMDSQISPVGATITTLRYQLYAITAMMLALSVMLALIIARRVSKPLEEINKSAKELASGHYDISFNGTGFREIGELSATLNTAACELSKVEHLRRELVANISHDLRTPLALIYSYAEVMHDFPDEITANQTQIIMDETQRLTTLVNDVLDISKLEAGRQDLNLAEYNLTKSIATTTERVAELVKKDGYTITFERSEEKNVKADETKITQAFYNLLINAVNYAGEDKCVTVKQLISDNVVRIEVADTGEGVAPEEQPYIWDRYYKSNKKHKRTVTGTGLGLSIVKKIIEMHDGACGVESSAGNGSTFWFSLKRN